MREKAMLATGIAFVVILTFVLLWAVLTFQHCRATNSLTYCLGAMG